MREVQQVNCITKTEGCQVLFERREGKENKKTAHKSGFEKLKVICDYFNIKVAVIDKVD